VVLRGVKCPATAGRCGRRFDFEGRERSGETGDFGQHAPARARQGGRVRARWALRKVGVKAFSGMLRAGDVLLVVRVLRSF
jgi:hypothetical protein